MLGIDIGSKTIKIVELEKNGTNFSLVASGVVGYSGTTVDKMSEDKEMVSLAQIIKKLCVEAKISSKEATISIPEALAFTRTIKFPPLTDTEIASAIKWEAEQYIPIPVSEAIVQHTILRRDNASAVGAGVVVLLVAAPRMIVEKYVKVVQMAGLTPVAVETELIALTRSLAPSDKTVLLVDLGGSSTNLAIVKHGLLSFSRSLPVAGDAFTRAVSQSLSIAPLQAEEYKKTYGMSSQLEGKIKVALDSVVRLVGDEIKKAVNYYLTEEKGDSPTTLILTGGSSGMPELITAFSNVVGMEILIGNPFARVQIDPAFAQKLASFAPLYGVAVGLAMRDI